MAHGMLLTSRIISSPALPVSPPAHLPHQSSSLKQLRGVGERGKQPSAAPRREVVTSLPARQSFAAVSPVVFSIHPWGSDLRWGSTLQPAIHPTAFNAWSRLFSSLVRPTQGRRHASLSGISLSRECGFRDRRLRPGKSRTCIGRPARPPPGSASGLAENKLRRPKPERRPSFRPTDPAQIPGVPTGQQRRQRPGGSAVGRGPAMDGVWSGCGVPRGSHGGQEEG